MRLESAREDTISNLNGGKKFGIEASAKAFQVLSSNLYERKIEAIVRELGCNASDSHVQAGKGHVPFKVVIPTALNPKFVVQDFGLGLSQQEVEEVYTTYFKSTKTGTNDLIGGLGLGSKTPFSYTDSFMVTAIKDGIKCAFTCNIGQSGEPEVNKLFEVETSECNGVTVEVSVSEDDIFKFTQCARKVYQWFDVKPETNRELDYNIDDNIVDSLRDYGFYFKTNRTVAHRKTGFYKSHSRMVATKVIMGQVAYDLDINDVMSNASTDIQDFVQEMHNLESELYIAMPIGEADVNAGREKLSLDDRTIKNIQTKLEEIRINLQQTALDKASKYTSVMEADENMNALEQRVIYDTVIGGRTLRELKSNPIDFRDGAYPILYGMDDICFYVSKGYGRARSERRSTQCYADLKQQAIYTVIVNDCELKGGLVKAIKENYSLPSSVLVLFDKKTEVTPELHAELNHLFYGRYKIVMASSFWDGSRAAKKKARKIGTESIRCTVLYRNYTKTDTIDFSGVDKSKYAIMAGSARDHIFTLYVNGKRILIDTGDIKMAMRELGLEGVVLYNKTNEVKVKKNFDKSLVTLLTAEYNWSDIKALITYRVFRKSTFSNGYKIFESYDSMATKLEEDFAKISKPKVTAILSESVDYSLVESLENSLEGRYKVMKERKRILTGRSIILKECLTKYTDSAMISELKQYIKTLEIKGV